MRKTRTEIKLETEKFYVKIVRTETYDVTREGDPDDRWDGDDISHSHEIEGFELVGEKQGWDFILTEKPTGNWYLVCAFYSTGDSFHREDNCLSLVSFVKNMDDAKAIIGAIEKDYKAYDQDNHRFKPVKVHLPVANRDEEIYTGTWKGYFERLNYAEIKCLGENTRVTFTARRRW